MESAPVKRARSWLSLLLTLAAVWGLFQALEWWQSNRQSQALAQVLQQHPVKPGDVLMYTTSTCPYCARARAWLGQNHVPFTECNIELDSRCQAEFQRQGAPGVPLMQVRGLWNLGFDTQWVTLALQRQAAIPSTAKSPRP